MSRTALGFFEQMVDKRKVLRRKKIYRIMQSKHDIHFILFWQKYQLSNLF